MTKIIDIQEVKTLDMVRKNVINTSFTTPFARESAWIYKELRRFQAKHEK